MVISGLLRFSLIDFPGLFSCVVFLGGCNFRCGFCYNSQIVLNPKEEVKVEEFMKWLEERKNKLEGVVITGGEPLINDIDELKNFIKEIKKMGFRVKIDTNGSFPDKLKELIRDVDYVAMDVKTVPDRYEKITGVKNVKAKILESIDIVMKAKHEFRTTVVPGIIDEKTIEEIGKYIEGAKLWALQQFLPVDTVLDRKYRKVNPYPVEKLKILEKIASKFVQKVELRGV